MKLYARVKWTNAEGTHEVGDAVELPTGTDQEAAEVERLVNAGILSKTSLGGTKKGK